MRTAILLLIITTFLFSGACKGKAPASKPAPVKAAETAAGKGVETKDAKAEDEAHLYDKKGKRDPFVSLIAKTEEKKPKKGQTPLENYDVSAIKVLGIIVGEKGNYASIVLPDGKAYTLKEGMTIGLHEGKIQSINKDQIVIRELIKDYKGVIKPKETILRLREKEEE